MARQRVYPSDLFKRRKGTRVTERILDELREQIRVAEGRNAKPSPAVTDSQSVKVTDTVSRDSRGRDAGKKVNGRKPFTITDTVGLLVSVTGVAASRRVRGPRRAMGGGTGAP